MNNIVFFSQPNHYSYWFVYKLFNRREIKQNRIFLWTYLNPILNVLEQGTTTTVLLREFEWSRTEAEGRAEEETPFPSSCANGVDDELLNKWVMSARGILFNIFLLPFFLKDGAMGGIGFLLLLFFFVSPLVQTGGVFSLLLSSGMEMVRSIAELWSFRNTMREREREKLNTLVVADGIACAERWGI